MRLCLPPEKGLHASPFGVGIAFLVVGRRIPGYWLVMSHALFFNAEQGQPA